MKSAMDHDVIFTHAKRLIPFVSFETGQGHAKGKSWTRSCVQSCH